MKKYTHKIFGSRKKTLYTILGLFVCLVLLALILVLAGSRTDSNVVAIVNDESITTSDLEDFMDQSQTQDKQQALANLIDQTLWLQDAQAQGITVTDEALLKQYQNVRSQFPGTDEQFSHELVKLGTTEAELREVLREEMILRAYISTLQQENTITVSDQEVEAEYARLAASSDQEFGTLEEMRAQIGMSLMQQKLAAALGQRAQELRDEGTVQTNL